MFKVGTTYATSAPGGPANTALVVHEFDDGRFVCVAKSPVSLREYAFIVQADGRSSTANNGGLSLVQRDVIEDFFVE